MSQTIREYIDSMTPERILFLGCRPEGVSIHRFRYREEKIARRAIKLREAGKLRVLRRSKEDVTYCTTESGKAHLRDQSAGRSPYAPAPTTDSGQPETADGDKS